MKRFEKIALVLATVLYILSLWGAAAGPTTTTVGKFVFGILGVVVIVACYALILMRRVEEIDGLQERCEIEESKYLNLNAKFSDLTDKYEASQATLRVSARDIERLMDTTKSLRNSNRDKESALSANLELIEELRNQISWLEATNQAEFQKNRQLERLLDEDHCIAMRAQGDLITAKADLESMMRVLSEHTQKLARYKQELKEQQKVALELEGQLKNYRTQKHKLEEQLVTKNDTIQRQQTQISALNLANEAMKRELQEGLGRKKAQKQQQTVQALNNKLSTLMADAEANQALIERLQDELAQAETERATLLKKYARLQEILLQANHDNEEIIINNNELEAQIAQLMGANQELSEKLNVMQHAEIMAQDLRRCVKLLTKAQNAESLSQLVDDGRTTTKAEDMAMALRREVEELTRRLCAYIDRIESLTIAKSQLQEDITKLKEELEGAKQN